MNFDILKVIWKPTYGRVYAIIKGSKGIKRDYSEVNLLTTKINMTLTCVRVVGVCKYTMEMEEKLSKMCWKYTVSF